MDDDGEIELQGEGALHLLTVGRSGRLHLTDGDLIQLAGLLPAYLRQLAADRVRPGTGLSVRLRGVVTDVRVNQDLHGSQVLLSIDDDLGGSTDYALSVELADVLGQRLVLRAERLRTARHGPRN